MRLRKLFSNQRGVATIKFSLTVVTFFTLILFFAEMMYITYISAALDLAISEAAKKAKNSVQETATQYQNTFKDTLSNSPRLLWGFMREPDITVETRFCHTINELKSGCLGIQAEGNRIARYKFSYNYHPLFLPYPTYWANRLTTREVIFVQESQNMPNFK
ncbi:pilus assembly protein [Candidatus Sodalis endolongispinus]|uniref:Pilus assembly protein n=1 Tax=Candidatus Sodalis endolongispinus TaxID=2812662 RepID=A0ABS5YER1_9GAMM|nr:pilus assembly protein [Candidatus Sodalis endolongispinus]MBT9433431.1 pilus assembly protein [Candidatus Sodalis endolongispinus]